MLNSLPTPAVLEDILILSDDSESTRDFLGLTSFYNTDNTGFLSSVVSNTDFNQCRVGIQLFSDDVREVNALTTNTTQVSDFWNIENHFFSF